MNVLVVNTNTYRNPVPVVPMGACVVAEAAEAAGHAVSFLDMTFRREPMRLLRRSIQRIAPDVVGLSLRNIDNNDFLTPQALYEELPRIVETIRNVSDATVVLGGAALGVMPEELLAASHADIAVVGNGESVFPRLLSALQNNTPLNNVPGLVWKSDGVVNRTPLDLSCPAKLPRTPSYGRWINVHRYQGWMASMPIQTKRGCPFSCVYCTYPVAEGQTYRLRDPAEVVEDVRRLVASGVRDIEFVDNVFNSPWEHAMKLCEALARAETGARFISMELNPRFIDDHLLAAMLRAGFTGIAVTAESASDSVLEGMCKGYSAAMLRDAADAIRRQPLPCVWIFMFGGPGETPRTVRDTLRFAYQQVREEDTAFFNLGVRVYPGTELESIARKQGLITAPQSSMLAPVFYCSPKVDPAWMRTQLQKAVDQYMNFVGPDAIGRSLLPIVQRAAYKLGVRPPLFRHTRTIRRLLRGVGLDR